MIAGLSGSILSHDALLAGGYTEPVGSEAVVARRALAHWFTRIERSAGPAWSARKVFDEVAVPFCRALGFDLLPVAAGREHVHGHLLAGGAAAAVSVAAAWGQDPAAAWRDCVRLGIAAGTRWCLCFNGPALRVFDATRTHSRRYTELDLSRVAIDAGTFALTWRLFEARAFAAPESGALDRAVMISERHRTGVRESLQVGVHDALSCLTSAFLSAPGRRRRGPTAQQAFDESLVVIYRVLFLLFAEARGLVPTWHPVFRESYTIESLRPVIETGGRPRGVWDALQAIARLAHRGCKAGTLRVPPFNGRLFSPVHAPLADALLLDEALVRDAVAALTTRRDRDGMRRIAYADLGVEHLGGVYERVLDFDLETSEDRAHLVHGSTRKSTGSFYTPRALTEYLVRRTLAPLVAGKSPDAILGLRVLDPAMGSGAFLVAACRYLAHAYEAALVADGVVAPADVTDAERAQFRRTVAQRCLYGIDLNPMAVQLARLSVWLATLSGDRPLTFFDHHLRTGNSLVGASLDDVLRGSVGSRSRRKEMPLFDQAGLDRDVESAVASLVELRETREDTLEQIRGKETLFAHVSSANGPLARWKQVADLWCAAWFDSSVGRLGKGVFRDLLGARGLLPTQVSSSVLASASDVARREHFFHWSLEFPEVFADAGGFDAVIGNPPWDVLRSHAGANLTRFSRESGGYHLQSGGHANLYQLFAERSLSIVRPGGRLGLVLPSGFAMDHGCARMRRHLLDETTVDSLSIADNRNGLFPIHRGLKFALLTTTVGGRTNALPCRFGLHTAEEFDRLPDTGRDPSGVAVGRVLLERISGDLLAIPELASVADVALVGRLTLAHPCASDAAGWDVTFGRELNATDDKGHFVNPGEGTLPVVEGKQVQPFEVNVSASRHHIWEDVAVRRLRTRPFTKPRVAYRDVAAATNRLTLIAAVLPPGTVTTHTLFCLKTSLDEDAQHALCALFNSFVANYLVRLRVTTHVTVSIIERLPLPRLQRHERVFVELATLARRLSADPSDREAAASLQALAAHVYGLSVREFEHVLTTFPLVDRADRERALRVFVDTL